MNPGRITGEFLQEHSAGNSASTLATADVLNVGKRAFDQLAIFIVGGELPHFFSGGFGAGQKLVGPGLIGTKDADVDVGQSDYNSAVCRERGGVNKMSGAELLGIVNSVCKD